MKKIPSDQHITYQLQFRKCGKPSCSTCKKGEGHGPYWYGYWRTGSRLVSGYIGKERPAAAQPQIIAKQEQKKARHMLSQKEKEPQKTTTPVGV